MSVVESDCEALVFSEVGAITAGQLVARIRSDQHRGPEYLKCHDRVYCVCAHTHRLGVPSASSLVNCIPSPFNVNSPSHRELSLMKHVPRDTENPHPADHLKLVPAISAVGASSDHFGSSEYIESYGKTYVRYIYVKYGIFVCLYVCIYLSYVLPYISISSCAKWPPCTNSAVFATSVTHSAAHSPSAFLESALTSSQARGLLHVDILTSF